jgi:hypothetical protein
MHQQFNIQQLYILPPHTVFMCFVFIWEQTETFATYIINWLVFITYILLPQDISKKVKYPRYSPTWPRVGPVG